MNFTVHLLTCLHSPVRAQCLKGHNGGRSEGAYHLRRDATKGLKPVASLRGHQEKIYSASLDPKQFQQALFGVNAIEFQCWRNRRTISNLKSCITVAFIATRKPTRARRWRTGKLRGQAGDKAQTRHKKGQQ